MRLSRRSEYGLRALVDLVRHQDDGPVALAALAERDRLPTKFLEQIMSSLKHAGIVRSTLGAHGGYALAVDPGSRLGRPGDPPPRRGPGAARLRVAAVLRVVFVRGRGDLPVARRHARCPRRHARDPRPGDPGRPGRSTRSRLDRPAWPPRRRPGRPEALTDSVTYDRTARRTFMNTAWPAPASKERPNRMRLLRTAARNGFASFVGFGRGLYLLPLDITFKTVGLRYSWLKAMFMITPAPLLRGIGQLRAERAAWRASRRVPAYGTFLEASRGHRRAASSRSGSSAACRRRTRRAMSTGTGSSTDASAAPSPTSARRSTSRAGRPGRRTTGSVAARSARSRTATSGSSRATRSGTDRW